MYVVHDGLSVEFTGCVSVCCLEGQVSPLVGMGKGKDDLELGPPWLKPMLKANYFGSCTVHGDANKSECNLYCLDCMGDALCSYCLVSHKDHRVVQVQ